jgi:hypothetical protein
VGQRHEKQHEPRGQYLKPGANRCDKSFPHSALNSGSSNHTPRAASRGGLRAVYPRHDPIGAERAPADGGAGLNMNIAIDTCGAMVRSTFPADMRLLTWLPHQRMPHFGPKPPEARWPSGQAIFVGYKRDVSRVFVGSLDVAAVAGGAGGVRQPPRLLSDFRGLRGLEWQGRQRGMGCESGQSQDCGPAH